MNDTEKLFLDMLIEGSKDLAYKHIKMDSRIHMPRRCQKFSQKWPIQNGTYCKSCIAEYENARRRERQNKIEKEPSRVEFVRCTTATCTNMFKFSTGLPHPKNSLDLVCQPCRDHHLRTGTDRTPEDIKKDSIRETCSQLTEDLNPTDQCQPQKSQANNLESPKESDTSSGQKFPLKTVSNQDTPRMGISSGSPAALSTAPSPPHQKSQLPTMDTVIKSTGSGLHSSLTNAISKNANKANSRPRPEIPCEVTPLKTPLSSFAPFTYPSPIPQRSPLPVCPTGQPAILVPVRPFTYCSLFPVLPPAPFPFYAPVNPLLNVPLPQFHLQRNVDLLAQKFHQPQGLMLQAFYSPPNHLLPNFFPNVQLGMLNKNVTLCITCHAILTESSTFFRPKTSEPMCRNCVSFFAIFGFDKIGKPAEIESPVYPADKTTFAKCSNHPCQEEAVAGQRCCNCQVYFCKHKEEKPPHLVKAAHYRRKSTEKRQRDEKVEKRRVSEGNQHRCIKCGRYRGSTIGLYCKNHLV